MQTPMALYVAYRVSYLPSKIPARKKQNLRKIELSSDSSDSECSTSVSVATVSLFPSVVKAELPEIFMSFSPRPEHILDKFSPADPCRVKPGRRINCRLRSFSSVGMTRERGGE